MNPAVSQLLRAALGRQLSATELAQVAATGEQGAQRAAMAQRAYEAEDAIVQRSLKAFFTRKKPFGKEHNDAYAKCERDTRIFYRLVVAAAIEGDERRLLGEVDTWFITILNSVHVHLDDTFLLWILMLEEIELKLDIETQEAVVPPLVEAIRRVEAAITREAQPSQPAGKAL